MLPPSDTSSPTAARRCAIADEVVDLPLVPVTPIAREALEESQRSVLEVNSMPSATSDW